MTSRCSARRFRRAVVASIAFLGLLPLSDLAIAGQAAASIVGQVKDESGGVLPGVTVTAKVPPCRRRTS